MKILFSDDKKIFNIHTDGIPCLSFDMLDRLGIPNLFSTRFLSYDDASDTGVEGLRVAVMKTDDINEAAPVVIATRDRLASQIGSSVKMECIIGQKHTADIYVVTPEDLGPVWPKKKPEERLYADGIATDMPDVLLTVFGGDCPAVYLADPVRKASALVHAGWRGTLKRISSAAMDVMTGRFGCDPKNIYAAIGPGICGDCYEMGDEVYDAFASEWGEEDADRMLHRYPAEDSSGKMIPGGKYHLDLRTANLITLQRAGIPEDHIAVSNVCTRCNSDIFYSHRAHRLENEQAAMLVNRFGEPIRSADHISLLSVYK